MRGGDGGFGQLCLVLGLQNLGTLQIQTDWIDYYISHPIEKAIMVRYIFNLEQHVTQLNFSLQVITSPGLFFH